MAGLSFESEKYADAADERPGRVDPPYDFRKPDEDPLNGGCILRASGIGHYAVIEEQGGERREECKVADEAARRMVAEQDMGDDRAEDGERSRLNHRIGDDGQIAIAQHLSRARVVGSRTISARISLSPFEPRVQTSEMRPAPVKRDRGRSASARLILCEPILQPTQRTRSSGAQ